MSALEEIMQSVVIESEHAIILLQSIRGIADRIEKLRQLASDVNGSARDKQLVTVACFEQTELLNSIVDHADRGVMQDDDLTALLVELLSKRMDADAASERARNIAQALQGRVLREPV